MYRGRRDGTVPPSHADGPRRDRADEGRDGVAAGGARAPRLLDASSRARSRASTTAGPADPRLDELADKLAELDARVTRCRPSWPTSSTELGNDIDALNARPAGRRSSTRRVLGEIRDGQVRLANEQARYQIAFREDLARLAEQLRPAPPAHDLGTVLCRRSGRFPPRSAAGTLPAQIRARVSRRPAVG